MKLATVLQRLSATCLISLVIIGDACAQQPRLAPASMPLGGSCYRLSYSPDSLGYHLPALIELVSDGGYWFARPVRWQPGDVQRPTVRESYKLSNGTAVWRQRGDSLFIESMPGVHLMQIHVRRIAPASAYPVSDARAEVVSWKGRAYAYFNDATDHVEGDVSFSKASCDAFHVQH